MILITQNTICQITAALRQSQLSTGSNFLFQLINPETKDTFSTIVQDYSFDTFSYNTFYVPILTGSADPFSGSLYLPLPGFYSYSFYELTGSFTTSSAGLNLLEIGKAQVLPFATSSIVAFTSSNTPSAVFNPRDYNL